jgi:ABC-type phosphate transport system substrate-binding protein
MNPTRTASLALSLCVSALCLALFAGAPAARADGGFVFIRSAKNASTKITSGTLRDLITGRAKKWPSGPAMQLVLRDEESAELTWIAANYFSSSGRVLFGKIRQEVFKGELRSPLAAASDDDTIAKVKANEGGLGVVKEGTALPPGVALLTVEE